MKQQPIPRCQDPAHSLPTVADSLTLLAASCTMNWVRALSSAVRAFGLHPKGRPFKSDSAHHCDAPPFSGDVVQLVRTLPCHGRGREFESRRPLHIFQSLAGNADSGVVTEGNTKFFTPVSRSIWYTCPCAASLLSSIACA